LDTDYKKISAESVIHWFKADRPGQSRGIPEIMPALPLFAQLRRFTLAVIAAAETAADFAAVLFSDTSATGEPAEEITAMDTVELERRMATVLPAGWKLGQMEAIQPNSTYVEFAKTILCEIARCFSMPFNKAWGNSSGYNYASGRLDHQTYYKNIDVDRSDLELICPDRLLRAWWDEAILLPNLIPVQWRNSGNIPHQWFWDEDEHVDPAKEATAQDTRLKNKSTNYSIEYAKQGRDWETEFKQSIKELTMLVNLARENNLPLELVLEQFKPQPQTVAVDNKDDEE
jgi:capsid protein